MTLTFVNIFNHSHSSHGVSSRDFWLCSSFNDKPVNEEAVGLTGKDLFEKEQDDLLDDLIDIPKKACDRRVRSPSFSNTSSCPMAFQFA